MLISWRVALLYIISSYFSSTIWRQLGGIGIGIRTLLLWQDSETVPRGQREVYVPGRDQKFYASLEF